MTRRALSFGAAAVAYERYRPGYSPDLGVRVLAHADGPVSTALEIGAGTGKATRVFVALGVDVSAVEPDAGMLVELQRQVEGELTTVNCTLESLADHEVTGPFDLVYAAASLHWTDPETRLERIAALLRPGGVFAAFGGPSRLADAALRDQLARARRPILDDRAPQQDVTPGWSDLRWPATELAASPLFTAVHSQAIERRATVPREEYVGYLSTVSAYLQLSAHDRATVLTRIAAALPREVEVNSDITLHLARRAEPSPGS